MSKSPKSSSIKRQGGEKKDASVEAAVAPLRRRIEDALRKSIISGQFAPGDRLRERDLIEMLNVSRTSLREALRQIEAEGLVAIEPNRGPVVTTVSYEEVEEIYEVRSVLEAQACSGFAERGSSIQMTELREIFSRMKICAKAEDVRKTLELKTDLYRIILEGCGNGLIGQLLSQLHNRVMLLRQTSMSEPTRMHEMLHEISTLLDAMQAHDSKAAWSISVHHINQAKRAALKVMRINELRRVPRKPARTSRSDAEGAPDQRRSKAPRVRSAQDADT